jgi:hypothetical protein
MSTALLLQKWFDEVWNKANESFIDEMMHKEIIMHGLDPSGTTYGIDNFKAFYKNFRETFPIVHVELTPLVHNDECATAWCHITATATKRNNVSFTGLCVGRYKNETLVEAWNSFDFLKMYQQLGHILVEQIEHE